MPTGRGVWHRDIKPANLIMTRTGRLKGADSAAPPPTWANASASVSVSAAVFASVPAAHTAALPAAEAQAGASGVAASAQPLSDALMAQSIKLLAGHLGPIAKLATQRAPQREAFFAALGEAVTDRPSARLLGELARLA